MILRVVPPACADNTSCGQMRFGGAVIQLQGRCKIANGCRCIVDIITETKHICLKTLLQHCQFETKHPPQCNDASPLDRFVMGEITCVLFVYDCFWVVFLFGCI